MGKSLLGLDVVSQTAVVVNLIAVVPTKSVNQSGFEVWHAICDSLLD